MVDGARVLVFLGELFGQVSPVTMYSDLVGAEVTVPAGATLDIAVAPEHEHGLLCDTGVVTVGEATAKPGEIVFSATGPASITVRAGADEPARFLLLGGAPFGEQIVMWWNFIGRSHDEVVDFREQWQQARQTGGSAAYGAFPEAWEDTLPAPGLPNLRLRSRG